MSEFYFWYMKSMPNHSGLVQKDVTVTREGTTFTRRQWVRPDEAELTQKFTKEELAKIYHEFTSNSVDGHTYACRALKESGFHWEESSSPSENWRRAKMALEHMIDMVFFPSGDKSISSGGQNKFDIEVAKKEYLKYLTNVPQKNRIWLEYYAKNTDYVLNTNLDGAFAYSIKKDVIFYNPTNKDFGLYAFQIVNTHELAHRIDTLNIQSWNKQTFNHEIEMASRTVLKHFDTYSKLLESGLLKNVFLSDIMSALSHNKLNCSAGHPSNYWDNDRIRTAEIFADMFCINCFSCNEEIGFLNKYFPKLCTEYNSLFSKYEE